MKKFYLFAATALVMVSQNALAAGHTYKSATFSAPTANVAKIVDGVYSSTIAREGSAKYQTALVDINHDGVAEIAVRFEYKDTCGDNGKCLTAIIKYDSGSWQQVFSHRAKTLAVADMPKGVLANLRLDGTHVFEWVGGGYKPFINSYVTQVMNPDAEATGELQAEISKSLGAGSDGMLFKEFNAGAAGEVYALIGDEVPGRMLEGPFFVWSPSLGTILKTYSHGMFGLSAKQHDGAPDIITSNNEGMETWSWSASKHAYTMSATSYVSSVSPQP